MCRADYVNDPHNDFELILEIYVDENEVGKIFNDAIGQVTLLIYANDKNIHIPCEWLVGLISDFQKIKS